jgi:mono/diheme cytochrome c family protein
MDADKAKQITMLLNGQNNGTMPAWKQLSDTEIAAVITYTKNNWSQQDRADRAAGRDGRRPQVIRRRRICR